ncbi:MAG: hypothetical protein EZS28_024679, partial [Streblomastix strix]
QQMYVMNGGNDSASHDGKTEQIEQAFASVTKAISASFSGANKPLVVNVGTGTFNDHQLNVGARGIQIVGKGAVNTTMINSRGTEPKTWLASVVSGELGIESMSLHQSFSSGVSYGGLLVIRGDGQITLNALTISQLETQQHQASNEILATGGNIQVINSSFDAVTYDNRLGSTVYAAGIRMQNSAGNLVIDSSVFASQHTSVINAQVDQNPIVPDPYHGGVIVLISSINAKITNTIFQQNDGWRTGGIFCQEIESGILALSNCSFLKNVAVKARYTNVDYKVDVGSDVILDHLYKRNNIIENILISTSTSSFPKVGSVYIQFDYGVFDYLFGSAQSENKYIDKTNGLDQEDHGSLEQPYASISFAIMFSSSAQERSQTLQITPETYAELSYFIGGRSMTFIGTVEGEGEKQKRTIITNSEKISPVIFLLYNGTLVIEQLIVEVNTDPIAYNSGGMTVVELNGQECDFTANNVVFRVKDKTVAMKNLIIQAVRGCTVTLTTSSFENIKEENQPLVYNPIQYNSICDYQNITFLSYYNNEAHNSALYIEHHGSGIASLNNCNFKYNVAKSPDLGKNLFGSALTIQLNYQGLLNSTAVELIGCIFDSNVGECCGAISIIGVSDVLSNIVLQSCTFMNNVAYSCFKFPKVHYANDIYFDMPNIDIILAGTTELTIFRESVSYSCHPQINYRVISPAIPVNVDSLFGVQLTVVNLAVVYVSTSGSDITGSGEIEYPFQSLSHSYARVDKQSLAQILVQNGLFNVSYITLNSAQVLIQGQGYHLSALTNEIMPNEGMFWLQSGVIMHFEDFTLIQSQCINKEAPMFEVGDGAKIRIQRCNFRSNHIDKMPDVTKDFYNSPIIRIIRGQGGIYDVLFYKIYTSGNSPIQILQGIDDMNWDITDLTARLDASKAQQAATTYLYKTPNKFEMKNCTFKQIFPYKGNNPSAGPPAIPDSVTLADNERNEFTPTIRLAMTPRSTFNMSGCTFIQTTGIEITLNESFWQNDFKDRGQIILQNNIFSKIGQNLNLEEPGWDSSITYTPDQYRSFYGCLYIIQADDSTWPLTEKTAIQGKITASKYVPATLSLCQIIIKNNKFTQNVARVTTQGVNLLLFGNSTLYTALDPGNASTNGLQLIKNLYGDQNIDAETTSPSSVIVMGQTSPLSGSSLTYSCSSLPVASGEFDQYDSSVTTQTLPSAQFDNNTYSDVVTTNLLLMAPTNDIEWNITLQYEGTYIETQIHIPF